MASQATTLTGHQLIADTLRRLGVTHAFGVSGSPIHQTLAACSAAGVRPIGVRHQQGGVMMSLAHNYTNGCLSSVVLASAGPGVTNCFPGIHLAHDNAWPLLVIGGRRDGGRVGGVFQQLDALPIVEPITKWRALVTRGEDLPELLCQATQHAIGDRPGPVYLDVLEAALNGVSARPEHVSSPARSGPSLDSEALDRAASLLESARRPLLIIGKGARWSEPFDDLRDLVELLQMPFVSSPMGAGFISDEHPLCVTPIAGRAQGTADVAVVVGARMNWQFRFGAHLAPDARLVHIDIDDQALRHDVRPTIGIVGDAREAVRALLDRLEPRRAALSRASPPGGWLDERVGDGAVAEHTGAGRSRPVADAPVSPYELCRAVARHVRDAITVLDANVTMLIAQRTIPCLEPATRLNAGSSGFMGVGVPFAVGAKLARPDRPVIAVCGDSAFGFSAMEMETAVRHRVPIVVIVANNGGISGTERQRALYPPDHDGVAAYGSEVRYEQVAAAVGAYAEYVERLSDLEPALGRALASGRAACVHVKTAADVPMPSPFPM